MASAAQIARNEDDIPAAELVARFTGTELYDAAHETSRIYNGIILKHALIAAQIRARCFSIPKIARQLGIARTTLYRWVQAHPCSDRKLHDGLANLVLLYERDYDYEATPPARGRT